MYTINSHPINNDILVGAVLSVSDVFQSFLDDTTGEIITDMIERPDSALQVKNFHLTPKMTDRQKLDEVLCFVSDLLDRKEDEEIKNQILNWHQESSSYLEFNIKFKQSGNDWYHGWLQYLGDKAWEYAGEWLMTLDAEIRQKMHECEGCEICKIAQNPYATQGDYMQAFQKQREKNDDQDISLS